ncbi:MAG: hypothetical protein E6Q68_02090 [Polynucleobacter sp.]|nr:MAG: hypothetical protein E6Q68_02090 [Polynucleobacter sp.]
MKQKFAAIHRGQAHTMPNGVTHTPYYFTSPNIQGKPLFLGVLSNYPEDRIRTRQGRADIAAKIRSLRKTGFTYIHGHGPTIPEIIDLLQTSATILKTDNTVSGLVPEHTDYMVFSGIITTDTGRQIQFVHRVYAPHLMHRIQNAVSKFAIYSEELQFSQNSFRKTFISQPAISF